MTAELGLECQTCGLVVETIKLADEHVNNTSADHRSEGWMVCDLVGEGTSDRSNS